MPGGRDFQRGDIWGDEDEDNQKTFDVGLADGWEWQGDDKSGVDGDWRWDEGGMYSGESGAHD